MFPFSWTYPLAWTCIETPATPPREVPTLRDYFAGQALAGLLADPTPGAEECREGRTDESIKRSYGRLAYAYADAMLAERESEVHVASDAA